MNTRTYPILRRKLLRDMRRSATQFMALILLCVLGTFLFAGIDGISRMADATNTRYFEENRLADFWISMPSADRRALSTVRSISGVEAVCARFSMDMKALLPSEPTLNVTACDGEMTVNVPTVVSGERLDPNDTRGCLIQEGFAAANGLAVGDRLTVRLSEIDYSFVIRGIVFSPEFISVTDGVASDPTEYGFILVNAGAFSQVPLTQLAVRLAPDADAEAVRRSIAKGLPDAFIIDRTAHRSTAVAQDNVTMFRSLSIVFPLAAFVVAALIVMTTLTRMIDNQRMQIGMLRALGYSSGTIERHYLSYAVWPSLIGSVLGAALGHVTLPPLIWALLIGQNEYPYRVSPPISIAAWAMVGVSVAMSVFICMYTYHKAARETAADLLRPKPPKAGRRNLLERVAFVWKRMSFNAKMVVRNLTRSKMRTLTSCAGLLCCNVLIIASMGVQDSALGTVYNHYGGTLGYDVRAELDDTADDAPSYRARLEAEAVECVMERSASISFEGRSRTTLLTVTEDDQRLLRLGEGESLLPMPESGVVLTEKLARILGAEVGDTVTFQFPGDTDTVSLPVEKLACNNFTQGATMSRSAFEGLRKGAFVPTAVELLRPTDACMERLEGMSEVEKLDLTVNLAKDALIQLNTVSSVFGLLMVIALALAFVICYNMGLINFAERTREYATLKVLGYHQREIRWLILAENIVVTVIALALSIVPGIAFTSVILAMCETDSIRYVSQVATRSIILSTAITFAFSILIQLLLARKVRTIVMVEALKSVE